MSSSLPVSLKTSISVIINDRVFEVKLLTRMTGAVYKNIIKFFQGVEVEVNRGVTASFQLPFSSISPASSIVTFY